MSATVRAVLWFSLAAFAAGMLAGNWLSVRPCVDLGEQLAGVRR